MARHTSAPAFVLLLLGGCAASAELPPLPEPDFSRAKECGPVLEAMPRRPLRDCRVVVEAPDLGDCGEPLGWRFDGDLCREVFGCAGADNVPGLFADVGQCAFTCAEAGWCNISSGQQDLLDGSRLALDDVETWVFGACLRSPPVERFETAHSFCGSVEDFGEVLNRGVDLAVPQSRCPEDTSCWTWPFTQSDEQCIIACASSLAASLSYFSAADYRLPAPPP